jgi:imidazolonepropionase-like amidohydrolase
VRRTLLLLRLLAAAPLAAQDLAITHVTIIDPGTGLGFEDRTVTIRGDRILGVSESKKSRLGPGIRVINGKGKFLIPGLWDMHVHVFAWERRDLAQFVRYGVTGVRDLGGVPDSITAISRDIAAGHLLGPRIVLAGRTLDQGGAPHIASVRTAEEGRAAVRANAAAGAKVIKVWSNIPREALLGAAEEAKRQGLPLVGHISLWTGLTGAIDAGQRGIEHTITFPVAFSRDSGVLFARLRLQAGAADNPGRIFSALIAADVAALASRDDDMARAAIQRLGRTVFVCPTLTDSRAYTVVQDSVASDKRFQSFSPDLKSRWTEEAMAMSPEDIAGLKQLFPAALRLVGDLHRGGVPLLAGTDAGSLYDFPGSDLHNELALMVRAGLTPLEALKTATWNPARAMGLVQQVGSVAPGLLADLVLLDKDPSLDIRNIRRIAGVVAAGKWIEPGRIADRP